MFPPTISPCEGPRDTPFGKRAGPQLKCKRSGIKHIKESFEKMPFHAMCRSRQNNENSIHRHNIKEY